jgi:hypothetical protein
MWRRVRGDAHDVFRAPSESLFGTVAPNNFLPDVELGMAIATKRAINAGHRSPHLGHIPMQGWESWEVQVLPVDNVDELLKIALGRAFPDHLPPARPLEISSQILLTKGRVPVLGAIGHMSEIYSHLTLGGIQTISPNGTDLWFDADGLSSESRDPSVRDRAMFAQLATQRLDQPDVSTALLG